VRRKLAGETRGHVGYAKSWSCGSGLFIAKAERADNAEQLA
jgi:hypothetical protein